MGIRLPAKVVVPKLIVPVAVKLFVTMLFAKIFVIVAVPVATMFVVLKSASCSVVPVALVKLKAITLRLSIFALIALNKFANKFVVVALPITLVVSVAFPELIEELDCVEDAR